MSQLSRRRSHASLGSFAALLLGTESLGGVPALNHEAANRPSGLLNQRPVSTTPSVPLGLEAGDLLPENGARRVPVDTLLRIGFDNPPIRGSAGRIGIYRA